MATETEQLEALKGSTIMLVDDEPTTIETLKIFLESEGYSNFITISDPRAVLHRLETEETDVVVLDLHMPHVGGFEILEAIRTHPKLSRTPVLMLTSANDPATKLEALELGATDFLGKPVDPSELALRLRNTLAAKAYQDRLSHYDGVTGLPSQNRFIERTDRTLATNARGGSAILHIQLIGFQRINDALGYGFGDALLRAAANRIGKFVRSGEFAAAGSRVQPMLARVGRDEFALFVPGIADRQQAETMAGRILEKFDQPFRSRTRDVSLKLAIGISMSRDSSGPVELLLRQARICSSRRSEAGGYLVYDAALGAQMARRMRLEHELRHAIERDELRLEYQPKVDTGSNQILGAEALIRWNHPTMGRIPPNDFIPLAEEIGFIDQIGEWALREACRQAQRWQVAGLPAITMSVNVSAIQFAGGALVGTVRSALADSGIDPGFLVLELTEGTLIEDLDSATEILNEITRMNVSVSVDDFGTGYSALSHLSRLPLDELKIDRSFVQGIPGDQKRATIVRAIVALAHGLGLSVVAEGVETREQLAYLRSLGCDQYQGYLYSAAVPPERWAELVRTKNGSPV
jgi:diguanylate cyclase (GGDEF)-like protein